MRLYLSKIKSKIVYLSPANYSKTHLILFAALCLFLFSLYFVNLGKYNFTPDEISIVRIADDSFADILEYHKNNIDPPLERMILHLFAEIAPNNKTDHIELILRLPYLIFSLLTLVVCYSLTKLMTQDKITALLSVMFCSALFYFFRYSQEARYYSMYSFFFLLSNYYFYKIAFNKDLSRQAWIKLLIINLLSFYLNIFTLFNIAIQSIYFLYINHKNNAFQYMKYLAALFLFMLPWISYNNNIKIALSALISFARPQMSILGGTDWLQPRSDVNFFKIISNTSHNLFIDSTSFLLLSIAIVSIIISSRNGRNILSWIGLTIIGNYILSIGATLYLIPGVISDSGSTERRMIFLLPIFSIFLLIGIAAIRNKIIRHVAVFSIIIVSVLQIKHSYDWVSDSHTQSKFLYGVDSKKEYQGVRDIISYAKQNKLKDVTLVSSFSTGDAVLDYYFTKNKIKHRVSFASSIAKDRNDSYIFTYQRIGMDEIPFNDKLVQIKKFGNYELHSWHN